jgi:hypothetical protein
MCSSPFPESTRHRDAGPQDSSAFVWRRVESPPPPFARRVTDFAGSLACRDEARSRDRRAKSWCGRGGLDLHGIATASPSSYGANSTRRSEPRRNATHVNRRGRQLRARSRFVDVSLAGKKIPSLFFTSSDAGGCGSSARKRHEFHICSQPGWREILALGSVPLVGGPGAAIGGGNRHLCKGDKIDCLG